MKKRILLCALAGVWSAASVLGSGALAAGLEYPPQAVPSDALTPGTTNPKVTQDNIQKTACNAKWVRRARPPTSYINRVRDLQLKRSDLVDKKAKSYAEDFRIPLEVGGGTDPGNMWPQPVGAGWSAKAKDKLEIYVQREVCAGHMSLKDGQQVFQKNWIEVFQLYCGPKPDAPCNAPGSGQQIQATQ
jgi:hypothetical protein